MAQSALIIGGGFTAPYLKAAIEATGGRAVIARRRPAPSELKLDLFDPASIIAAIATVNPTHIYHMAGISFTVGDPPGLMQRTHIDGTAHVLDAARSAPKLQAIILASSGTVYGRQSAERLDETLTPHPNTRYAQSKLDMENMAAERFADLPWIVSRAFNYSGPGQQGNFLIPKLVSHFRERAPEIALGNLDVARDFSDVRDIARDLVKLGTSGSVQMIVNLCSGQLTQLGQLVAHLSDITGHHPRIIQDPEFMRADEIKRLCGCPARLEGLIGARQLTPLQETLRWMVTDQS